MSLLHSFKILVLYSLESLPKIWSYSGTEIYFLNVGSDNIDSKLDFTAWVTDSFSLPSQESTNTFQDTLSPSGGF